MSDLPEALFKRWVHAREEDAGGVSVYRPAGYRLPPARGRDGLEFKPNGEVVRFGPAADDRSAAVQGRWSRQEEPAAVELQYETTARTPNRFTLVEVDDEVLRLQWLP